MRFLEKLAIEEAKSRLELLSKLTKYVSERHVYFKNQPQTERVSGQLIELGFFELQLRCEYAEIIKEISEISEEQAYSLSTKDNL